MSLATQQIRAALRHLSVADPVLKTVIQKVGPCTLRIQKNRFQVLVRSIISQQISTSAARTIRQRFEELVAPAEITPDAISSLTEKQLRSAGVSQQKASYLIDLSRKIQNNSLRLNQIGRLADEKVIAELTQVKGIGRWTAQMFLMFCLGRPDVLPHDDLGIRSALRNLYGLNDLPDKTTCKAIAQPWRPYTTVACWYCWRSLELPKIS